MGWTVLYIAFGLVALWLLGEVLLQYKARLRWRLLAFGGFLGVVLGVLIPSVPVITVGAIAFATGQTYVTLSFRSGFSTGWAIGGSPKESRRRRARGERPAAKEPTLEVSGLEVSDPGAGPDGPAATAPDASVYETRPMPDDTGQYGVYGDTAHATGPGGEDRQSAPDPSAQPQYAAYDPYSGYDQQQPAQDAYTGPYGYGADQQSYAAYSDPYIGTTNGAAPYGGYDAYGSGHDSQGGGQPYADPYGQSFGADPYGPDAYATDTPPGGVWVPHQRDTEQYPPMPPEQPAPYGNGPVDGSGYDPGQNDRHRY
ncbi:hypothetical protein EES43_06490 [Streptomyces sp. ADI96-02]|uniref:hypothetical protein n=1 Tax=Streptomyces sp. ADI96-02 TaxID=1522760 RepID=UPI000F559132|nr:hypothetical protein [Streptomyces sp. ADI96-02]RPK66587.1 hypothetical protein EES43_06490 [Streptomyces sp. ADI96-02]